MGNIPALKRQNQSAGVMGDPIDPRHLFLDIFGDSFRAYKRKFDKLPEDQKLRVCKLFGDDEQFMESKNNGATWTNNKIQDEEEDDFRTVMEELVKIYEECSNKEITK